MPLVTLGRLCFHLEDSQSDTQDKLDGKRDKDQQDALGFKREIIETETPEAKVFQLDAGRIRTGMAGHGQKIYPL